LLSVVQAQEGKQRSAQVTVKVPRLRTQALGVCQRPCISSTKAQEKEHCAGRREEIFVEGTKGQVPWKPQEIKNLRRVSVTVKKIKAISFEPLQVPQVRREAKFQ
jgi:hypothetical protein